MTNWKDKAIAATRGTQFGAIVACALGRERDAQPRFNGKASVTSDGFVMCNFTKADGEEKWGAFVGSLSDVVRNTKGLADHLKLSADERKEYGDVLAGWISGDYSGGAADKVRKAAQ